MSTALQIEVSKKTPGGPANAAARAARAAIPPAGEAPRGGEGEDRLEPLVVQEEALRAGVELDAARTAVEAAAPLVDGVLGQVESREGDEQALRARRGCERPVVRGTEGRAGG